MPACTTKLICGDEERVREVGGGEGMTGLRGRIFKTYFYSIPYYLIHINLIKFLAPFMSLHL